MLEDDVVPLMRRQRKGRRRKLNILVVQWDEAAALPPQCLHPHSHGPVAPQRRAARPLTALTLASGETGKRNMLEITVFISSRRECVQECLLFGQSLPKWANSRCVPGLAT